MVKEGRKYIVFFLVTASLFTIKQSVVQNGFSGSADYARLINIAGRQRMYSQKVAKLFSYYYNIQDSNIVKQPYYGELSSTLLDWKDAQEELISAQIESATLDSLLSDNLKLINGIIAFYDEKVENGSLDLTYKDFSRVQLAEAIRSHPTTACRKRYFQT
jgi:hypothetical protein